MRVFQYTLMRGFVVLLTMAIFCCGCAHIPSLSGINSTNASSGTGVSSEGGSGSNSDVSRCTVPPEIRGLTLSDCQKLKKPFDKAACISGVALAGRDSSICMKLSEETLKAACISIIAECTMDESLCDDRMSDAGDQYTCLTWVARAKKDVSICDAIDNTNYKNPCIQEVASARKEVSLCNGIESNSSRDDCIEAVAVSIPDASLCNKLGSSLDYWKHQCIMKVAMVKQDIALCDEIPVDPGNRMTETCVKNISEGKTDPSMCDSISNQDVRDFYCLTPVAVASKDESACSSITDKRHKNSCIAAAALAGKDVSMCQDIAIKDGAFTFPDDLNECVTAIAKATHSKALCEKAYDASARKACQSRVT
jgi:hypothetical protein